MRQSERIKLNFGPFGTPRYRLGQMVVSEARGEVTIVGTTDGKIPWPIGKRGRAKSLVLYGDLTKAVKKESPVAIRHWWGIGYSTINNWRKIYSVPPANPGTSILRSKYRKTPAIRAALRKAWAKARDPVRCEKIAASKRGKKRPPHVIARMMAAKLGKPISEESRRKMSEGVRRRGARPSWLKPGWSSEEDQLLQTMTPAEVAKQRGRSLTAVYVRRYVLGLNNGRTNRDG